MWLKREYDKGGKCTHFRIKHTGLGRAQNFSSRFVEGCIVEGTVTVGEGTLTLYTKPEKLKYTLKRRPGYYCASTGERIPISDVAWGSSRRGDLASREARAWLKAKGLPETDYEVTNAYECELDSAQHEKYRAMVAVSGNVVAACNTKG